MTTATTGVDAPRTVMWSISQIADRDGVSKQAVSKRVTDLVAKHGLTVERNARGHIVAVNVAEHDHLRGLFANPSKSQAPVAPEHKVAASESYDEALRQKTWHEAERRRLELARLKGELVSAEAVTSAVSRIGADIAAVIDRLPSIADDIAAAVAREGAHGARVVLKKHTAKLREEVANVLVKLASSEPETEADSETA